MPKQVPNTVEEFVKACETLNNKGIYELFEDVIGAPLRSQIYTEYWSRSPEPCRAAMNMLGIRYCVRSLENY